MADMACFQWHSLCLNLMTLWVVELLGFVHVQEQVPQQPLCLGQVVCGLLLVPEGQLLLLILLVLRMEAPGANIIGFERQVHVMFYCCEIYESYDSIRVCACMGARVCVDISFFCGCV